MQFIKYFKATQTCKYYITESFFEEMYFQWKCQEMTV